MSMTSTNSTSTAAVTRTDREGNSFTLRAITCPTCGPHQAQEIVGIRGGVTHRYEKGVECTIVRCTRCGLYFPNPFPYPVDAQRLYGDPSKYFAAHDMDAKVTINRGLIRGFIDTVGRKDLSLLDVGSGRGEFLAAAKAEGVPRVVGLELSRSMIAYAKAQFGVEVLDKLIEDFALETTEKFDVIVLNAVLEHVYDPDAMIAACAKLLSPDGLLYIDIPNEDHLLARVGALVNFVRRRSDVFVLSPTFPPFHVFGFSRRSLRFLLAKHGLKITRLRVYAQPRSSSNGGLKTRILAVAEYSLHAIANRIGMASNMYAWVRWAR